MAWFRQLGVTEKKKPARLPSNINVDALPLVAAVPLGRSAVKVRLGLPGL